MKSRVWMLSNIVRKRTITVRSFSISALNSLSPDDVTTTQHMHVSGPLNHVPMTNQSVGRQDSLINNEHKSHKLSRLENATCFEENLVNSNHFSGEPEDHVKAKNKRPISVLDHGQITQSRPAEHPTIMANGKKVSPVMIKVA